MEAFVFVQTAGEHDQRTGEPFPRLHGFVAVRRFTPYSFGPTVPQRDVGHMRSYHYFVANWAAGDNKPSRTNPPKRPFLSFAEPGDQAFPRMRSW